MDQEDELDKLIDLTATRIFCGVFMAGVALALLGQVLGLPLHGFFLMLGGAIVISGLTLDLTHLIFYRRGNLNGRPSVKNRIRALRFNANEMTQAELAAKVGVTRQTVIAIENGKYSPSLELAFASLPLLASGSRKSSVMGQRKEKRTLMNESELYFSRRKTARIAGAFYAVLALAMFPQMLRDSLIVVGDAAATGRNILANALLFRMSIFGDLVCYVAFAVLAMCLYSLLKDVGREAARLMVALVLVAVPIAMLSASNELAALVLLQGNDPAQAMLFLGLFKDGILIAEIFMGLWLFPLGWLFF